MIRSNLSVLRARKEQAERRRLSYREIAAATGLSTGTLVRLFRLELDPADRVAIGTLGALCEYFGCGVGELLEYVDDEGGEGGA